MALTTSMELPPWQRGSAAPSRSAANENRRDVLFGYVSTYVVAAKLVTKLGVADLAILAADRAANAALDADSLVARGMA